MREILFRGKRVDNGEWVEGDLLQGDPCIIVEYHKNYHGDYNEIPVVPETVGQYIGFKDRKGRMIYEGDIYFFELEHDKGDERHYIVVTWIKQWSMFSFLNDFEYEEYIDTGIEHLDSMTPYSIEPEDVEKMHYAGTIHDNPAANGQNEST